MRLESSLPSVNNPTEADIAEAVRNEDNEFVILNHDDGESFMQTSGSALEYRVGPTKEHFRCADELSSEQIVALMAKYSRGDESYRTAVRWNDVSKESRRGCAGVLLMLIGAATGGLAAGLAAWRG